MGFRITLIKRIYFFAIILTITSSCKRTEIPVTPDLIPTNPAVGPVNDAAQVTASVSGIVLDESNTPIANAAVTSGTASTTTNSNGMFIFQNISLSKENGNVTVVKAGYFKGVRSFKTTAGKNHTVRIQLMQRTLSGTVNAAAGGTITSNGGATIVFPANAFVTSTGAAYTGTVNVYSRWIDPTAANLPFVIPGDLRGVSTTGVENILTTYGMVGAELTDATGNLLKIATGKTATVSFPIPTSLSATAPASIVLWHFDDASARWKENGTATKNGSIYSAQVDKFSFWNVDVPNTNFINLDYTLVNATTNSPLVSTSTRIKRANGSYGYGITNNAGFVSGLVPKNEALVLEVIASSSCGNIFYSQNIGPYTANTSLGNINVTIPAAQTITFTGTLVNCTAAPVSNGYVSLVTSSGTAAFAATNATGNFAFSILTCAGTNIAYSYQGTDYTTTQQGAVLTGNATSGNINLNSVAACGTAASADVYVAGVENGIAKVWKNGVATNLSNTVNNSGATSVFVSGLDVYVAGFEGNIAKIWKNGVGSNLGSVGSNISANAVYVSGPNVYVAGAKNGIATFWKNGVETSLSSGNTALANSIFVSGSDVYVAGSQYASYTTNGTTYTKSIAKIWKNGVETVLPGAVGNQGSEANSIFVSGSDVYIAGIILDTLPSLYKPRAVLWKNGVATFLEIQSVYSEANSVFIVGNDVYVAGAYETLSTPLRAVIWKNGFRTELNSSTSPNKANSIFVKNLDVYVAGSITQTSSLSAAFVWKNGVFSNFFNTTNNIKANSIFVK